MRKIVRFYVLVGEMLEYCFNCEIFSERELLAREQEMLRWLFACVPGTRVSEESNLQGPLVEIGPRLNFETPFSSNAVSIFKGCGIEKITCCELSVRHRIPEGADPVEYAKERKLYDRMTQTVYPRPLESFELVRVPEEVYTVPVLEKGSEALFEESRRCGYGWDTADVAMILRQFTEEEKRNPTNVELAQWGQANSDHSRHTKWRARRIIDGQEMPDSLLRLIKQPWEENGGKSTIAFFDNASAVRGPEWVYDVLPEHPWESSQYVGARVAFDITFTAETHNHPTGVAPFQGAETGPGGRLRDNLSAGRGSEPLAGMAGYSVSGLRIPEYNLAWETPHGDYPNDRASALEILVFGSDGATDYENKFGEPVIGGFAHSYDIILPDGTRWGYVKPILFTGGAGRIRQEHRNKGVPAEGDAIVMIGGPAYRIGFGGGSASSQMGGENSAELDFDSVQRGNAEMGQRVSRAIRACLGLGKYNPILAIHDQGAGGPCNVLTELVYPAGGKIQIRRINLGDPTLPVVAIWIAEYQERCGIVVRGEENLAMLRSICERENVPIEVLGNITGDGRIVVMDERDDSTPVDMNLASVLGDLPPR